MVNRIGLSVAADEQEMRIAFDIVIYKENEEKEKHGQSGMNGWDYGGAR